MATNDSVDTSKFVYCEAEFIVYSAVNTQQSLTWKESSVSSEPISKYLEKFNFSEFKPEI